MNIFHKLKSIDIPLAICSGLLIIFGLTVMYSIALSSSNLELFWRQFIYVLAGLSMMAFFAMYDYHKLTKLNRYLYPTVVILLIFVLIFAREIKGSTRWIDFGLFQFQPAEFAKLVIIIGLSRWLYLARGQINSFRGLVQTSIYASIPAALVILEPDLGSAIIMLGSWAGLLLISPLKKRNLAILALVFVLISGVAWKFVLQDYQKRRVEVFLNPELDPRGKGYNVRQALIAVGSGGLVGRGLGEGQQSQLNFLPERQTDFVFASASEEIGFLGSGLIVAIYAVLLWRLIKIMQRAPDSLGFYLCGGVFFMLVGQVVINIGMNIGLLPVTGIPLPLISYGGSAIVVVCIALGIAHSVARGGGGLRA